MARPNFQQAQGALHPKGFWLPALFRPYTQWLRIVLRLRGSVIPAVLPKAIVCAGFGVIISALFDRGLVPAWPILGNIIPSLVLGLLLVFRTNTAYERFWEGRKAWGTLVNTVRNLTRRIWVLVDEDSPQVQVEKQAALYLIVAFPFAMKHHLRQEPLRPELQELMTPSYWSTLQQHQNKPLAIAYWIEDYLQSQYQAGRLDLYQMNTLNELLDDMVNALGSCERILKTPMPMAYAIHLKQLLLIYCLLLPFQLVGEVGWLTGFLVALVSFTLFGIEEIGLEIENPFGNDANDLPLDDICKTMEQNVNALITMGAPERRVALEPL
jgi:ion channel-forming bestrophin family protein